jgi:hypothetical protein
MKVNRSGRTSDVFGESLKKIAKQIPGTDMNADQRLEEHRKMQGLHHEEGTEEAILEPNRKDDKDLPQGLIEKNLEDVRKKPIEAVVEKQLNDAKGGYPHRNEEAYRRTGDKRPINALESEMGSASDDAKRKRHEAADKAGPPRILDKDVGKQLTNEKTTIRNASPFNLKSHKEALAKAAYGSYLQYMSGQGPYSIKFKEVTELDEKMAGIMKLANSEGRNLSENEQAEILDMKKRKANILGVRKD